MLSRSKTTRKQPQWRLSVSKFELDIVNRAGIKQQAPDELFPVRTKGEHKTLLAEEVSIITKSQAVFACAPQMETNDFKLIKEP